MMLSESLAKELKMENKATNSLKFVCPLQKASQINSSVNGQYKY